MVAVEFEDYILGSSLHPVTVPFRLLTGEFVVAVPFHRQLSGEYVAVGWQEIREDVRLSLKVIHQICDHSEK